MRFSHAVLVLLTAAVFLACSESEPSETRRKSNGGSDIEQTPEPAGGNGSEATTRQVTSKTETKPAVRTVPKTQPSPTAEPADLDAFLVEVNALVEMGDLYEALTLARRNEKKYENHPDYKQLESLIRKLKRARQQASQLMFATDKLASPQREVARYAKQQFRDAGWVGRVYLRKAVREKPAGVAAAAAELLTDEGGNKAVTAMLDRLGNADNTPEELTQVLGENMAELAGKAEPKHIRQAYRLFGKASDAGRKASARLLTAYYSDVTQADEAAFNKAAGAAEAYSKLRDMVRKELFSVEDKRRAWAEPLAADLHLYARGLRGQYFTGRSFDKLATTRLDKTPHQTLETLPYADNRKENISVRWTGQIQIETPGKYTFTMASDDGQRLWVDGEKVIDDWMAHGVERESGTVELKTGLHEIRIEWFQGDGGGETTTYWKGPGFEEEKLPADVLLTKPWKAMGSTVDAVQPGEK